VKTKLFVSGANFFTLGILWRIYSEELGDGRGDIDVVNVFQVSSLEVRPGIKYALHLVQPRVVAVLAKQPSLVIAVAFGVGANCVHDPYRGSLFAKPILPRPPKLD
jgi:hypothetical protein